MKAIYISLFFVFLLYSCNKDWLNVKADKQIVAVETLKDFEALLHNTDVFNKGIEGAAALAEIGTDNYFISTADWQGLSESWNQKAYVFQKDVFAGSTNIQAWNLPYQRVFYANVVLDGIKDKMYSGGEQSIVRHLQGTALFFRANAFFQLATLFSKNYNNENENTLGIPLRLSADINLATTRSTLRETYEQILGDLKRSSMLLPEEVAYKTSPTRQAAYGLLSRVYLAMGNYDSCLSYADKCLEIPHALIHFSELNPQAPYPIPFNNEEVIFSEGTASSILSPLYCRTDTILYASYGNGDLRRETFFYLQASLPVFKGNYTGTSELFAGIAVNEIYLNRAECFARKGDIEKAMNDLNTLISTRWDPNEFLPYETNDQSQALRWILTERRKELCFRGLRWMDLRRLNETPEFATTVERLVDGVQYKLLPNDPRYVYPIPEDIIAFTGIEQNER